MPCKPQTRTIRSMTSAAAEIHSNSRGRHLPQPQILFPCLNLQLARESCRGVVHRHHYHHHLQQHRRFQSSLHSWPRPSTRMMSSGSCSRKSWRESPPLPPQQQRQQELQGRWCTAARWSQRCCLAISSTGSRMVVLKETCLLTAVSLSWSRYCPRHLHLLLCSRAGRNG